MRRTKMLLLGATIVMSALGFSSSHACTNTGPATAAGSKKDTCGVISCGTNGNLPTGNPGGIKTSVNPGAGEVEACNDQGPGNTRGRLVVQTSTDTAHPGARVVLDTDKGQEAQFPPGYIVVQASTDKPGLYCNKETKDGQGTGEPVSTSDGYRHQWDDPGTQGGADANALHCVPTQ